MGFLNSDIVQNLAQHLDVTSMLKNAQAANGEASASQPSDPTAPTNQIASLQVPGLPGSTSASAIGGTQTLIPARSQPNPSLNKVDRPLSVRNMNPTPGNAAGSPSPVAVPPGQMDPATLQSPSVHDLLGYYGVSAPQGIDQHLFIHDPEAFKKHPVISGLIERGLGGLANYHTDGTFAGDLAGIAKAPGAYDAEVAQHINNQVEAPLAQAQQIAALQHAKNANALETAQTQKAQADATKALRGVPPVVKAGVGGEPATVTDGLGNEYNVNDPNLPAALKPLVAANQKAYTDNQEAKNPHLSNDQIARLNAQWNPYLKGQGKAPDQFVPGMTKSDQLALEGALNSATGREQGEQRIVISQQAADAKATKADPATEREYQSLYNKYSKDGESASTQVQKAQEAQTMLHSGAEGQALGAVKALSALAGGQGSGVRITQAELNSIAQARGVGGDIEGFINRVSGKGKLTDTQVHQLDGILSDVIAKGQGRAGTYNNMLDDLGKAGSTSELRAVDSKYRGQLLGASSAPAATQTYNGSTYTQQQDGSWAKQK